MKNKRGEEGFGLMGSTIVDVLFAIVILGLLFVAGYAIYSLYFGNQKEDQASSSLDAVIEIIETLELEDEQTVPILAPKDWHLVSFDKNHNFVNNFEKPFTMQGQNGLCICEKDECKICQAIDMPANMNSELFIIKIPQDINITKKGNAYEFKLV